MAAVLALIPIALLLASAGVAASETRRGWVRVLPTAFAWLALAAFVGAWAATRAVQEFALGGTQAGIPLSLRLDAVSFAFGFAAVLSAAIVVSLSRGRGAELATAALTAAAILVAIDAGSLIFAAVAIGAAITFFVLALDVAAGPLRWFQWLPLAAVPLMLAGAAAAMEVTGGTNEFAAIPVVALRVPAFLLVAGAGLILAGAVPGAAALNRLAGPSAVSALASVAFPVAGIYLLVRLYEIGDGRYPAAWLNAVVVGAGLLAAIAAALRAQAAPSLRDVLAESVPALSGFGVIAAALGTRAGIVAAVTCALTAAASLALVVVADTGWRPAARLLTLVACAGLPPALTFGARLLVLQAGLEAGEPQGLVALVAGLAWLLWLAGVSRAMSLPAARPAARRHSPGIVTVAAAVVAVGAGLGWMAMLAGDPAAAEVMPAQVPSLAGGAAAVLVTRSGAIAALTLGGPVLLLLGLATWAGRGRRLRQVPAVVPPVLDWRWTPASSGIRLLRRGFTVPALLPRLEVVLAEEHPVFWVAVVAVLALVVLR